MKFTVNLNKTFSTDVEASTQADLFNQMAALGEYKECLELLTEKCGKCGNDNISCTVRVAGADESEFKELKCETRGCWAKLSVSQKKKGGVIYANRKDKSGEIRGSNGWVKWNSDTNQEE